MVRNLLNPTAPGDEENGRRLKGDGGKEEQHSEHRSLDLGLGSDSAVLGLWRWEIGAHLQAAVVMFSPIEDGVGSLPLPAPHLEWAPCPPHSDPQLRAFPMASKPLVLIALMLLNKQPLHLRLLRAMPGRAEQDKGIGAGFGRDKGAGIQADPSTDRPQPGQTSAQIDRQVCPMRSAPCAVSPSQGYLTACVPWAVVFPSPLESPSPPSPPAQGVPHPKGGHPGVTPAGPGVPKGSAQPGSADPQPLARGPQRHESGSEALTNEGE